MRPFPVAERVDVLNEEVGGTRQDERMIRRGATPVQQFSDKSRHLGEL